MKKTTQCVLSCAACSPSSPPFWLLLHLLRLGCILSLLSATTGAVDLDTVVGVSSSCGVANETIAVAGSSTVYPIAQAWGLGYEAACAVRVSVTHQGRSSEGAARLCAVDSTGTPVDIASMSRDWSPGDEATADASGYKFQCAFESGDPNRTVIQLEVAIDGLSVVVKAGGLGQSCIRDASPGGGLTLHQLRWMFSGYNASQLNETGWEASSVPNSDNDETTHLWSELSPNCPKKEIKIAGPYDKAGTYEYFKETILSDSNGGEMFGNENRPHGYFNSSETSIILQYVENDETAIGYVNYAEYVGEGGLLYAASIQNVDQGEFVPPNTATVESGQYNPLSRRLYMNLFNDAESLTDTVPFMEFGLSHAGTLLVQQTNFVPLPATERADMIRRIGGNPSVVYPPGTTEPPPPPSTGTANTSAAAAAADASLYSALGSSNSRIMVLLLSLLVVVV